MRTTTLGSCVAIPELADPRVWCFYLDGDASAQKLHGFWPARLRW